jgi:hypothetical protein
MVMLEKHMTTQETTRPPIILKIDTGKIHVYPILADHNPHLKNIKFFAGSKTQPQADFKKPYDKTRANDWLEGSTFSFLIDYLNDNGVIELRIFIQSSSCNPPAGVPPAELLKNRQSTWHFSASYHIISRQTIRVPFWKPFSQKKLYGYIGKTFSESTRRNQKQLEAPMSQNFSIYRASSLINLRRTFLGRG